MLKTLVQLFIAIVIEGDLGLRNEKWCSSGLGKGPIYHRL